MDLGMSQILRAVRGMKDRLPEEMRKLTSIVNETRRLCELYGYQEVEWDLKPVNKDTFDLTGSMIS
jgi:hypothetical protein